MFERLKILAQHAMPKRHLTEFAGRVAASSSPLTPRLIQWFAARYGVNMSEAENPDLRSYASFNDFFTRPLKAGARPLADADFICPVDGAISQFGAIDDHHIVQAKGHRFTAGEILGGDSALAATFRDGSFANLYLSPKDYHRLHMPCSGELTRMVYVPGSLFSVNPTARGARSFRAQRARHMPVRVSLPRPFRNDPRGCDHRRQHRDGLAWRGECEAIRQDIRMVLRQP